MGTAKWKGVLLADILEKCKPKESAKYVWFEGADELPLGKYATSMRIEMALDRNAQVIVALQMNGENLPPDHGYPCRMIIPGWIGGRMVKWLKKIIISDKESDNYYHLHDNKILPTKFGMVLPDNEGLWRNFPEYTLYEMNINSAFFKPSNNERVSIKLGKISEKYCLKGYAYTGGGRKIVGVEITFDDGKTWEDCELIRVEDGSYKTFTWVHFKLEVEYLTFIKYKQFSVRATDSSYNTQPREPTWNIKGFMNNCWYTIKYKIVETVIEGEKIVEITFLHPSVPGVIEADDGWMVEKDKKSFALQPKRALLNIENHLRNFTLSDVEKHVREDSCWIVINGTEVIDVTAYLKDHPGGKESILAYAGKDATSVFKDIHSQKAHEIKGWYHIGNLISLSSEKAKGNTCEPRLKGKHWLKARMIHKIVETHDTIRLTFEIPSKENAPLGLPTGQHLLIGTFMEEDIFIHRPYTPIYPSNEEDDKNNGQFVLLIKVYRAGEDKRFPKGGLMSQFLDKLKIGEEVIVKGPTGPIIYHKKGIFTINARSIVAKRINFCAGGTGITPIFQLLKAFVDEGIELEVCFIYANKTVNDILMKKELDNFKINCGKLKLKIWHVVEIAPKDQNWEYDVGRINDKIIQTHLIKADIDTVSFICGPPPMVEFACKPGLENIGFSDGENIFEF